ncbi:MAG TPA: galactokinase [Kofleriaceae bacterium]|nr:galactokinase [Kofleriaceae bacterium]
MLSETVSRAFVDRHGRAPRLFAAPGRVNLIGEHTDYNDGFVMPVAIDRATVVAAAPRADRRLVVTSLDAGATLDLDLDALGAGRTGTWGDYVAGVAAQIARRGVMLVGADVVLASDVPTGAGLSSSAALEMSLGVALVALAGAELDRVSLAQAAQAAEHEFVGTRCGIMDQFIAGLGRAGHALLIDCRSLESTLVPLAIGDRRIVLCDSKVKHDLATSAYNERRAACERAVELLRPALPGIRALRDVTPEELDRHRGLLPPEIARRAAHVVGENARTLAAAGALRAGDLAEVGRLMAESHRSLRDDYEVSGPELDLLVAVAADTPGVTGARMTGGGFGGCTVNLVEADAIDAFTIAVTSAFEARFGRRPDVFAARAADGARELVTEAR